VVEHASSEPFTSFVRTHILNPLKIEPGKMAFTAPDPSNHAAGYLEKFSFVNLVKSFLIDRPLIGGYEGRWLRIADHYVNGPAFGGLVGTARAFGRFLQDQAEAHSVLWSDTSRASFIEQQRADGRPVPMTLGWHIGSLARTPYFFKEGGGAGFHSMMRLYPKEGLGTAGICS
jgi:CubicO group peptidase (beta-lactamase class C family)